MISYNRKSIIGIFCFMFCIILVGCSSEQSASDIKINKSSEITSEVTSKISSPAAGDNEWEDSKISIYSDLLCGLVKKESGSDLVVVDPETSETILVKYLDDVSPTQANAISPNGEKIAYSQFITYVAMEGTYLIVENLITGTVAEFFKESDGNQLIEEVLWLPDNTSLLIKMSIKEGVYYTDVLCILNTETCAMTMLDCGKFMYGNNLIDEENKIHYYGSSQVELDELIKKYGGSSFIPVDENGGWNNIEISNPSISPDGNKVLYNVTFYRNSTPPFHENDIIIPHLWLASGIWIVDIDGKSEPQLIWGNDDTQSNTGKAIWTDEPNTIIFTRYFNELSHGSNHIESLDISSKETEIIVEKTEQLDTNIPRCSKGNYVYFVADGIDGEKNMIYDSNSNKTDEKTIIYDGEKLLLWRFNLIS